jgi:hypothetical protein
MGQSRPGNRVSAEIVRVHQQSYLGPLSQLTERFTPNSDRESGLQQTIMSALPPKADMCGANRDVRFGPKADIAVSLDHLVGASG